MKSKIYYVEEIENVKKMGLPPIDSATLISLAALLGDYHEYLQSHPECTMDEFYEYKKVKLLNQRADTAEWKQVIESDPNYQMMMAAKQNDNKE
jgi:hypothetical protein